MCLYWYLFVSNSVRSQLPASSLTLFTCFRSTGAVAELFDISCLPSATYSGLTDLAFAAWNAAPPSFTVQEVISDLGLLHPAFVLGQHYFIVNPLTGAGLSPKWDFTSASEAGHPSAFVVGAKTGDVPAPADPETDVDWLSLSAAQGALAQQVFRVETRGGQPPASVSGLLAGPPPGTRGLVRFASARRARRTSR